MLHHSGLREPITDPSRRAVSRFASLVLVSVVLGTACIDGPTPPQNVVSRDRPTSQAERAFRQAPSSSVSAGGSQRATLALPQAPIGRQPMFADSLRKWSAILDRIAEGSKRGAAAVAMRRQILVALSAPAKAGYHAAIAQLPVTARDSLGVSNGETGVFRNYAVNGVTRVRVFTPERRSSAGPGGVDELPLESDDLRLDGPIADGGAGERAIATTSETCTTDFMGYYDVGECATAQEQDDAMAQLAAMDAEIAADNAEAQAACSEVKCDEANYYEIELSAAAGGDSFGSVGPTLGGPHDESASDSPRIEYMIRASCLATAVPDAVAVSGTDGTRGGSCLNQALVAGFTVAGWIGVKYSAVLAISGASTAGVGWIVFGAMTSGWGAAVAVMDLYNCAKK